MNALMRRSRRPRGPPGRSRASSGSHIACSEPCRHVAANVARARAPDRDRVRADQLVALQRRADGELLQVRQRGFGAEHVEDLARHRRRGRRGSPRGARRSAARADGCGTSASTSSCVSHRSAFIVSLRHLRLGDFVRAQLARVGGDDVARIAHEVDQVQLDARQLAQLARAQREVRGVDDVCAPARRPRPRGSDPRRRVCSSGRSRRRAGHRSTRKLAEERSMQRLAAPPTAPRRRRTRSVTALQNVLAVGRAPARAIGGHQPTPRARPRRRTPRSCRALCRGSCCRCDPRPSRRRACADRRQPARVHRPESIAWPDRRVAIIDRPCTRLSAGRLARMESSRSRG